MLLFRDCNILFLGKTKLWVCMGETWIKCRHHKLNRKNYVYYFILVKKEFGYVVDDNFEKFYFLVFWWRTVWIPQTTMMVFKLLPCIQQYVLLVICLLIDIVFSKSIENITIWNSNKKHIMSFFHKNDCQMFHQII